MALAVLVAYLPNQGDAGSYIDRALSRYFEQVLSRSIVAEGPPPLPSPEGAFEADLPPLARELVGGTLEDARLLGQRLAEFHLALASITDDPAFAPEPFTTLYQRSLYQSLRSQARKGFELLRKRRKDLPETVREEAQRLLDREEELLVRAREITEARITARKTRDHGDLKLSQILVTGGDLFLIDLEGDPSRPLSDRRRKRSPWRDVACMVRSFHAAAFLALEHGRIRPEDARALRPWAYAWRFWVSTAFVRSYREVAGTGQFLASEPAHNRLLLEHYLIKRIMQELRTELSGTVTSRVQVPIEGLRQLLDWQAART
jgi:maltose alpha-D-glucosyltransferase/alpha-amylase